LSTEDPQLAKERSPVPDESGKPVERAMAPELSVLAWARVVPVTAALIVVNTVFFALEELWGGGDSATFIGMGAILTVPQHPLDPRTLITYGYLHFSVAHLVINMYALWGLGRSLEPLLGPWRFFVLYTLSLIGGGVFVAAFTSGTLTVGASGAIFGLLGAVCVVLMIAHQRTQSAEERRQIRQHVAHMLLPNIVISLFPGVSFAGHAGGLVVGTIFILVAHVRRVRTKGASTKQRASGWPMRAVAAALALLTVFAIAHVWLTFTPWRGAAY
jgi:membrane associated rhomboid family serine protease